LKGDIPICYVSIAGTRVIGRMTAGLFFLFYFLYLLFFFLKKFYLFRTCIYLGNKNGLLLPSTTTDQEMLHIRNTLPDTVVVQVTEETCETKIVKKSK
jgi:translation initiation factor 6